MALTFELLLSGRSARSVLMLVGLAATAAGCGQPSQLGPVADPAAADKIYTALVGESAVSEDAEAAPTGTGWATLKGRFVYDGDPPQMPPYAVNKDEAVCKPGGQAPTQEFLVVDSATKGVANIVIYPRKVTRVHESAEPSEEPVVFDQKVCVFLTHVMPLGVGQPVEIKNSDDTGHNTNIEGQNKFNQTIPGGESVPYTAQREEGSPVAVRCSIHPWMLAYMLPRSNAYVAVTKPDGSFEISNLPAGEELEIQVWHESATGPNRALVLDTDAAKELEWDKKGRFTITLEPDQSREIEITVPPAAFSAG